ncbi:MAG: hypothetical protein P8Z37_06560 [Acidobacteriota bacterium]
MNTITQEASELPAFPPGFYRAEECAGHGPYRLRESPQKIIDGYEDNNGNEYVVYAVDFFIQGLDLTVDHYTCSV